MDFVMEAKNRQAKKFLSHTAKEEDWTLVYRNLDDLDMVSLVSIR